MEKQKDSNTARIKDFIEQLKTESEENLKKNLK